MELQLGNFQRLPLPALTGQSAVHVESGADFPCALHPATAQALQALRAAATAEGLDPWPVSGYRSFEQQLTIWNAKFTGRRPLLDRAERVLDAASLDENARVEAILLWSALPGASRHHWGTDLDLIDRAQLSGDARPQLQRSEYEGQGLFSDLNRWLDMHAADFGFFRPYDIDRGGVQPEPWHLSFAPIAATALPDLTLDVLAMALVGADLAGRATVLTRLPEFHERYVMSVASPPQRALRAQRLR